MMPNIIHQASEAASLAGESIRGASRSAISAVGWVRRCLSASVIWARVQYWSWTIGTKVLVSVVYLPIIAQGLRYMLPDIGMKLYRLPGLAALQNYKQTYRLDLAFVFSIVPLICAWLLWSHMLQMYLRPDRFAKRFHRWDVVRVSRVVAIMGTIIVVGDACLFCAAFVMGGWGGARFSVSAVVATAVYVTVIGFVTFVSLCLSEQIEQHLEKE